MRFFIIGLPGSGKSYWGKKWAELSQFMHFDLDEIIENNEGEKIKRIFEVKGEVHFRNLETFYLQKLINNYQAAIISCGGGTPCYNDNISLMNEKGISIFLNPHTHQIAKRLWQVDSINKRPLLSECKSLDDVIRVLDELKNKRITYYKKATHQWNAWDESSVKNLNFSKA